MSRLLLDGYNNGLSTLAAYKDLHKCRRVTPTPPPLVHSLNPLRARILNMNVFVRGIAGLTEGVALSNMWAYTYNNRTKRLMVLCFLQTLRYFSSSSICIHAELSKRPKMDEGSCNYCSVCASFQISLLALLTRPHRSLCEICYTIIAQRAQYYYSVLALDDNSILYTIDW